MNFLRNFERNERNVVELEIRKIKKKGSSIASKIRDDDKNLDAFYRVEQVAARVCSTSNLIGARRKPGGRRPGNPVSRRATKNRFFVRSSSSSSSSSLLDFSLFASLLLELNANAPLISPILSSAFTSIARRRFSFGILSRRIAKRIRLRRRKFRFSKRF